jgi:hypothetical protein
MSRARRWFHASSSGIAVATALLGFASLGGCQTKDSLIVVTASAADDDTTGLHTLVVTCGSTSQVFHVAAGISTTEVTVGLYVPSGTTGSQTVTAKAVGTACGPGYLGSSRVVIGSAGSTVATAITMVPGNTCPSTSGGTGGTSGTSGTGGNSACVSAAQPPVGTPPQFGCCVEYDQDTPENCSTTTTSGTEVDAVAFSPDGKTLVTAAGTVGNDIKVWSFNGHTLTDTGTVLDSDGWLGLAFSPDGTLLAVPVSGGVDLWNTSDWSFDTTLLTSSKLAVGAVFTPDGKHIIAADESANTPPGSLYVFDLTSAVPEVPVTVVSLAGRADNLAVAGKAVSGQLGVAVAYEDGSVDVFSYANATFTGPTNLVVDSGGDQVWGPAFSPDGSLLAVGDSSSTIHFWAFPVPATLAESGSEITFSTADPNDVIFALAFSPNGGYLAAGGGDLLQDAVDSRAALFTVSTRSAFAAATSSHDVGSIAFSPLGNAVAGGEIDCGRFFMCTN